MDEQKLVKLYMELTGCSEANARAVFMLVSGNRDAASSSEKDGESKDNETRREAAPRLPLALLAFLSLLVSTWCGAAETNAPNPMPWFTQPLSVAESIDVALRQNPDILRARKDVEAVAGVSIQTRAIALPRLGVDGNYNALDEDDIDRPSGTFSGLTFGTDQSWRTQVKVVQSIYEGGKLLSSFRVAKLLKERSMLQYQTVVADAVRDVQVAYYNVLSAEEDIIVQEASVELLRQELADSTRRFDAGTVPRFNVLRAEVELANGQPPLIRATNLFRITKNRLANVLGFDIPKDTLEDIPLKLSGKLVAEPYEINLSRAIAAALDQRTELEALRKTRLLRKEDIVYAKSGYKPSLQAFAGYDWHSSMFDPDLTKEVDGWIAGVQMSWSLFDGMATRGRVMEAQALYDRSGLDIEDAARTIELEVRTAYSTFIEARAVLESQKKVIEQAEETLRLARARSDAGTGTQLDVLSAQTAFTDARVVQVRALREYQVARVRLERAIGENLPQTEKRP